ncbi:MAG: Asp-tRNA(Asn)/Glu-tRNA(Gln) amidotransferase subunit GatC [Bdellovibrionales bacterium]|nr:Asp-tRNA(Asn)/Glu-tRNA(Gln) amidotransferase subunit GatC [Bdellovibrionales bacterium]
MNEALTRKVADLARLELTDDEVQCFTRQLGDVLAYVAQLKEVNVEGVEPMVHPIPYTLRLREDEVEPPFLDDEGHPKVLKSAPDAMYDGYKVPQIV